MKPISRGIIGLAVVAALLFASPALAGPYRFIIAIYAAREHFDRPALPDDLQDSDRKGSTGALPDDVKPVGTVTVYVLPNCSPCAQLKRDVAGYRGLKFVFRQATEGMSAPTLQWRVGSTTHTQTGWTTLADFIKRYNASLKQTAQSRPAPRSFSAVAGRSRAEVSINGSHRPSHDLTLRHLTDDHGYARNAIENLTREQLWTLHDQAHGY